MRTVSGRAHLAQYPHDLCFRPRRERPDTVLTLPGGRDVSSTQEGRCEATWKRKFKITWHEASPPNHHDDQVDSDQWFVNKEICLVSGGCDNTASVWETASGLQPPPYSSPLHSTFKSNRFLQRPEIRNPKSETRNPEFETQNPKHETRNPKPETRNTKPETRNPKPETRNRCTRGSRPLQRSLR